MGNLSESHPLQQLFTELVNRNYEEALGHNDNELNSYVAGMLCEFCDAEQLFKIRNAQGRPLHDVGEMLLEGELLHRLQVRVLRVRQGGAVVRAAGGELRSLRARTEPRPRRSAGHAAPHHWAL